MAQIILVGCNKGGSGKTTTAVNLAVALAREHSVCLVDADRQRSASKWYERRENSNLDLSITLIERLGNITQTLKNLAPNYDYLIVDVAGRNSRELITGAVVANIILGRQHLRRYLFWVYSHIPLFQLGMSCNVGLNLVKHFLTWPYTFRINLIN